MCNNTMPQQQHQIYKSNDDGQRVATDSYSEDDNDVEMNISRHDADKIQQQQQEEEVESGKRAALATTNAADTTTNSSSTTSNNGSTVLQNIYRAYRSQEFIINIFFVIVIAYAYPIVGAVYCAPHITSTWIAVIFIFLLSGLGLQLSALKNAITEHVVFNIFVQLYNFGISSLLAYTACRYVVIPTGAFENTNLVDGMIICSCLPMTVSSVIVLTKTANGDEAAAIFNVAFGNLIGVFISPVLILLYLGVSGDVNVLTVFFKLAVRVVVPLFVGQVLQRDETVADMVTKYKPYFKQATQYCLVFVIYTVFCRTFYNPDATSNGEDDDDSIIISLRDILTLTVLQLILLVISLQMVWIIVRYILKGYTNPKLCVMGLYGCTSKTAAMGIPLITAIYDTADSTTNNTLAAYTLPLLVWQLLQLLIGTYLAPKLSKYVLENCEVTTTADTAPHDGGTQNLSSYDDFSDNDKANTLPCCNEPSSERVDL